MTCTHDWRSLGECPHCVAEERDRLQDDLTRLRAHHIAETSRLTREVLELRAGIERLRAALEGVVTDYRDTLLTYDVRRLQNLLVATPAPVTCHICNKPLSQPGEPYCSAFHATPAPVAPKEPLP